MNILDEIIKERKKSIDIIINEYKKSNVVAHDSNLFFNKIKENNQLSIISEVKFESPSMGKIREKSSIENIIKAMEDGGASGLSILTEPNYFNGSPEYIPLVRKLTSLPILMKDFFIHECQFYQAADLGANMVLLITAALKKEEISSFLEICESLHLETLIELHDEEDLEKISGLNAKIIGINNRNLNDFSIDLNTTKKLIPKIRTEFPNCLIISESGIKNRSDIEFVVKAGADAVLIGTSIMQSPNIKEKLTEFRGISNG
ncbi:MAG: indole-3-glycerol phosphate synthase TrpC [Candidatus Helarchaeota archaeon]